MSLYQINPEFFDILQKEELTQEDMEKLDSLSKDEREKAIIIAGYIKNITHDMEGIIEAIKTMQKRVKRLDNKIEFLSYKVKEKMEIMNTEAINDSPLYEIKLQQNPPHVHVFDELALPYDYWRRKETVTINRELIMSDIKTLNRAIPGVEIRTEKRLVIK